MGHVLESATVVQQSNIGAIESLIVAIASGLIVVFIPFILKYLNRLFSSIKDTAILAASNTERITKHNKKNKKDFKRLDRGQKYIIEQLRKANGNSH